MKNDGKRRVLNMAERPTAHAGTNSVHQQLQISLYHVEQTSYQRIRIMDLQKPHWIISHVLSGEVVTITRDETYAAKSGDVMIHPPHIAFSEIADQCGTHQWLAFDASLSPGIELFRLYQTPLVVTLSDPALYSQTFSRLLQCWQELSSPLRDMSCSAAMAQLMAFILESWRNAGSVPRSSALAATDDRFAALIHYLNDNIHHKITRRDIAETLHLNPGYLDRVFFASYGKTPMQMLREMRLAKARKLLETSDEPLSSIAVSCGLGDAAYLSRTFLRQTGMTPGQYRQKSHRIKEGYVT